MRYEETRRSEEISFDAALYGLCSSCGWPRTDAGRLETLQGTCPRCRIDAGDKPPHAHVINWSHQDGAIALQRAADASAATFDSGLTAPAQRASS